MWPLCVYGLGGWGGGFNLLYEKIMEEWKRGCILKGRTIQGNAWSNTFFCGKFSQLGNKKKVGESNKWHFANFKKKITIFQGEKK